MKPKRKPAEWRSPCGERRIDRPAPGGPNLRNGPAGRVAWRGERATTPPMPIAEEIIWREPARRSDRRSRVSCPSNCRPPRHCCSRACRLLRCSKACRYRHNKTFHRWVRKPGRFLRYSNSPARRCVSGHGSRPLADRKRRRSNHASRGRNRHKPDSPLLCQARELRPTTVIVRPVAAARSAVRRKAAKWIQQKSEIMRIFGVSFLTLILLCIESGKRVPRGLVGVRIARK